MKEEYHRTDEYRYREKIRCGIAKATKAHVRTVDLLIQDTCGVKRGSVLRYYLSTFKAYNGYVARKFSALTETQKNDMERVRKQIGAKTARLRKVVATENSRMRRGVR